MAPAETNRVKCIRWSRALHKSRGATVLSLWNRLGAMSTELSETLGKILTE